MLLIIWINIGFKFFGILEGKDDFEVVWREEGSFWV